jgi:hypothetical protein
MPTNSTKLTNAEKARMSRRRRLDAITRYE